MTAPRHIAKQKPPTRKQKPPTRTPEPVGRGYVPAGGLRGWRGRRIKLPTNVYADMYGYFVKIQRDKTTYQSRHVKTVAEAVAARDAFLQERGT